MRRWLGSSRTSLRLLIERYVEQLPLADQAILEAASVTGYTFSVAAVVAGIEAA